MSKRPWNSTLSSSFLSPTFLRFISGNFKSSSWRDPDKSSRSGWAGGPESSPQLTYVSAEPWPQLLCFPPPDSQRQVFQNLGSIPFVPPREDPAQPLFLADFWSTALGRVPGQWPSSWVRRPSTQAGHTLPSKLRPHPWLQTHPLCSPIFSHHSHDRWQTHKDTRMWTKSQVCPLARNCPSGHATWQPLARPLLPCPPAPLGVTGWPAWHCRSSYSLPESPQPIRPEEEPPLCASTGLGPLLGSRGKPWTLPRSVGQLLQAAVGDSPQPVLLIHP